MLGGGGACLSNQMFYGALRFNFLLYTYANYQLKITKKKVQIICSDLDCLDLLEKQMGKCTEITATYSVHAYDEL